MILIRQKHYSDKYTAYYIPFPDYKDHSVRYRQWSRDDRMVGPGRRLSDRERESTSPQEEYNDEES